MKIGTNILYFDQDYVLHNVVTLYIKGMFI